MNGKKVFVWTLLLFVIDGFVIESVRMFSLPLYLSNSTPSNLDSAPIEGNENLLKNDINVYGLPGQGYYITVYVGTPPQALNVLIDTGSSNFAVAAVADPLIDKYFVPENSSTFQNINMAVVVPYTMGSWEGFLGSDVVTISNVPATRTEIACITKSNNFFINGSEWQGILGLAYSFIARPSNRVTPFLDNLVSSAKISNIFSLQLCGYQGSNRSAGSLVLGGIDARLHKDQVRYTPLHKEWYYDIILTSVAVGKEVLNVDCKQLNNDKAIIDSGTTNLRLPQCVFDMLVETLKNHIKINESVPNHFWNGSSVMCWKNDSSMLESFPELRISMLHTSNSTFTLVISPKQYLGTVIEAQNASHHSCFKFMISPSVKGTVIGAIVMEGFYVIFDRENKRIGFAKSVCSPHSSNSFGSEIEGPFLHTNPWGCAYEAQDSSAFAVTYIVMILAVLCTLPLVLLFIQWTREKLKKRLKKESDDHNLIVD